MDKNFLSEDHDLLDQYPSTGWPPTGSPIKEPIDPQEVLFVDWNDFDYRPRPFNRAESERLSPLAETLVCGKCGAVIAVTTQPHSFWPDDCGWQCPNTDCGRYWVSTDWQSFAVSYDGKKVIAYWYYDNEHPPDPSDKLL